MLIWYCSRYCSGIYECHIIIINSSLFFFNNCGLKNERGFLLFFNIPKTIIICNSSNLYYLKFKKTTYTALKFNLPKITDQSLRCKNWLCFQKTTMFSVFRVKTDILSLLLYYYYISSNRSWQSLHLSNQYDFSLIQQLKEQYIIIWSSEKTNKFVSNNYLDLAWLAWGPGGRGRENCLTRALKLLFYQTRGT